MRRARFLPWLAASLMLPGAALADSEVEQLKGLVKRLEQRVKELERHEADTVESPEGITTGISFTAVAQKPGSAPPGATTDHSELNFRGDVTVGVPLERIGNTEQQLFGQIRFGQGAGLNDLAAFSAPNATAFGVQGGNASDSTALIAQAWYQATIPLAAGSAGESAREKLEVTFGKMDPFVFFDQNAAANDETRQFLNSAFVHNPLLDAGGDIGADDYGFAPGLRLSYVNERAAPESWRLSLGILGAGDGASFNRSFSPPMVIAQAEREVRLYQGLSGNYRAYAWRNGQAIATTGAPERHTGFGLSADQRVGDAITLFGRYGQQISGDVSFDRALTLGAEIGGEYWSRSADALGVAFGRLRATAAGADPERLFELYYRYRVGRQFELSPDLQLIASPGGDPSASTVSVVGLRAQITY